MHQLSFRRLLSIIVITLVATGIGLPANVAAATEYGTRQTGTIEGTVTEACSNIAMDMVTVDALQSDVIVSSTVTLDGSYQFVDLSPGYYDIRFEIIGHQQTEILDVEAVADQITTDVDCVLDPVIASVDWPQFR